MTKQDFVLELRKAYPTARPEFIDVLIEALETHAKKNNDYNGSAPLFPATGESLYFDIRRKFGRLHNIIQSNEDPMVDESIKDTALDLGVYAFLLVEELRKK